MGETLYRGPEILFRWGRLCFDTESPEGRFHISQGETLFRGRLYFVTPAPNRIEMTSESILNREVFAITTMNEDVFILYYMKCMYERRTLSPNMPHIMLWQ